MTDVIVIVSLFSIRACNLPCQTRAGVPILLKAGKALHKKGAEIRVQFRHVPGNIFKDRFGPNIDTATNELVIRIQPKEAIYLKINNKVRRLPLLLLLSCFLLCPFTKFLGPRSKSHIHDTCTAVYLQNFVRHNFASSVHLQGEGELVAFTCDPCIRSHAVSCS